MPFTTYAPIAGLPDYDPEDINPWYFTVVYCGNYQFAGYREGDGSHPGVDIDATKYPRGQADVYCIADGTVAEARSLRTGWGRHIVVKHENCPDPAAFNRTTTLYSCYCHLSKIAVKKGDKVAGGQKIGVTGTSGSSSGFHLHFQIDRESAPKHPFWPFTTREMRAAGFTSSWRAVDGQLGLAAVRGHTINPMLFVQRHWRGQFWFSDVHKADAYNIAVHFFKNRGVVNGCADGLFHPDWPVRRDEFVKIVLGALDYEVDLSQKAEFVDVPRAHWAQPFLRAATVAGLVEKNFKFYPERFVTRAEALRIILRAARIEVAAVQETKFKDITDSEMWYAQVAARAAELGLLDFGKFFEATRPLSRAELCLILWRILGEPEL